MDGTAVGRRAAAISGAAAIIGITIALLLPALFNGYPILFPDTADYLLRAETLVPSPIRAPGYAVWMRLAIAGGNLWVPVVAQSLLLAALVWRTLRIFARPTLGMTLGLAIALSVGTSVGWVSSKAMPDVFVAMVLLGLYLTAAHWDRLGLGGRILAVTSVIMGGTMHLTNVLVGAAALVAMLGLQRGPRPGRLHGRALLLAALSLAASLALTSAFDRIRHDASTSGGNGGTFVLGHLVETGLAQRLLQDRCGIESFALCPVRDTLTRSVDLFVWRPEQSPRYLVLHDDQALIRSETGHILRGVITRYPLAFAWSVLSYTGRQMVSFQVNDEIWRHRNRTEVQRVIARMFPGDLATQVRARQQANNLRLPWTSMLHLIVFLAAAAFSIIGLRRWIAAREVDLANAAGLHVVVWATLVANAAVCANLAGVFSRYQTRVSWLLPLAVIATLLERGALRRPVLARTSVTA